MNQFSPCISQKETLKYRGTERLARLVSGPLLHGRERFYMGISDFGESGVEQRGEMPRAFEEVPTSSS